MKTLRNLEITGALYVGDTGTEAAVGDQVKMFLDTDSDAGFPEFVLGIIQHPIVRIDCNTKTSYSVEYDEADLLGAADALVPDNVIDVTVVSALDAYLAGLNDKVQTASFSNSTGNTTITIPEGCELYTVYGTFTGSAGTRIIVIDDTNAVDGCEVRFLAKLPATSGIVIDVRALTTGGTQLDTITTDTSGDDALFIFGYTTEWNKLVTQYPN